MLPGSLPCGIENAAALWAGGADGGEALGVAREITPGQRRFEDVERRSARQPLPDYPAAGHVRNSSCWRGTTPPNSRPVPLGVLRWQKLA